MTDLVIFVGIVGLVLVVGILVGMIVAGRIDRILAPRATAPVPDHEPGPDVRGARPVVEPAGPADPADPAALQEERP